MERSEILILVVDDDPQVQAVLQSLLQTAGYRVGVASDADKGIEFAERESPTLVIAGVVMPGINGFQMCRRLKNQESTRSIPIILLSAKADPADHAWASAAGAAALYPKPINRKSLLARIDEHLIP